MKNGKDKKFTQGKWYVVNNFATEEKHDFQIACNCRDGSRQIAQILKRNYSLANDLPTLEESEANAHLISASPEMYEALKEIEKAIQENNGMNMTIYSQSRYYD